MTKISGGANDMNLIRYVEIENFKGFGDKLHIDLGHPAVLIGPNNAGKTSVIQALSLWSRGIKAWFEKKGESRQKEPRERIAAGINRLNILDVPVAENRFFWHGTRVRKGNILIEMTISVGIEIGGDVKSCKLIFTYRDTEVIYCKPCPETVENDALLKTASELQFHLLYPMSGIMSGNSAETEETPLPDGRINLYLGQGQTALVLRNICYKIVEQDQANGTDDWSRVAGFIDRLFLVSLKPPEFNEARGSLIMRYTQRGVERELDISLAGRGMQQVLLILAYLYWNKGSVLLIDEPDAHLEILRQKQVYQILKETAEANGCQAVIATHSEVILDDAVDTNLTLLLNGEAVNLAKGQDMKNALRNFGIEHYYKAKVHPRILYIEGSSDIDMLKALAKRLGHRAYDILSGELNCYYTRNIMPDDTMENKLDRHAGAYRGYKQHFYAIKPFVSDLKGIAIFDSDNASSEDITEDNLAVLYWKHYELENYFITPDSLRAYVAHRFKEEGELFQFSFEDKLSSIFSETMDRHLLEMVFGNDQNQLDEFHEASPGLKRTLLKSVKMSGFAESVFKDFAASQQQPVLLGKGEFYKIVKFTPKSDIPDEVSDKLDKLVEYLQWNPTAPPQ